MNVKVVDGEFWKQVDEEGFEHYYISHKGKLWNTRTNKFAGNSADKSGYRVVLLSNFDKKYGSSIHRLVAIAFIPNPENKEQVNHIDGNPSNNNLDNLEWVTRQENVEHARVTGLLGKSTRAKLDSKKEKIEEWLLDGIPLYKIAGFVGCSNITLRNYMKTNSMKKERKRSLTKAEVSEARKMIIEGESKTDISNFFNIRVENLSMLLVRDYGSANKIDLQIEEILDFYSQGGFFYLSFE